jgi:uncharacterized membrane protein YsdA (DUF1294 family)
MSRRRYTHSRERRPRNRLLVQLAQWGTVGVVVNRKTLLHKVKEWLPVLLAVAVVVATLAFLAVRRSPDPVTGSRSTSTSSTTPPVDGCDGAVNATDPCPEPAVIEEQSVEGATERYQADALEPSDVQYLLLRPEEWENVMQPLLGPSAWIPGGPVDSILASNGLLGSAQLWASWQQEWRASSRVVVEQIFVFASAEQATAVFVAWKGRLVDSGVRPVTTPEFLNLFPEGTVGDRSFSAMYEDVTASGVFASRRCVAQTLATVGSALVAVSLYQPDDCPLLLPAVPAGLLQSLEPRIRTLLPVQLP